MQKTRLRQINISKPYICDIPFAGAAAPSTSPLFDYVMNTVGGGDPCLHFNPFPDPSVLRWLPVFDHCGPELPRKHPLKDPMAWFELCRRRLRGIGKPTIVTLPITSFICVYVYIYIQYYIISIIMLR